MNQGQDDEANFDRRQDLRYEQEAFRLNQEEKSLLTARQRSTFLLIKNSILGLTGALGILLGLRFLLRLLGANPQNEFAQIINDISAPFIIPFSTLFISPTSKNGANIVDVNIVIAIVVYALMGYLSMSITSFIFRRR